MDLRDLRLIWTILIKNISNTCGNYSAASHQGALQFFRLILAELELQDLHFRLAVVVVFYRRLSVKSQH